MNAIAPKTNPHHLLPSFKRAVSLATLHFWGCELVLSGPRLTADLPQLSISLETTFLRYGNDQRKLGKKKLFRKVKKKLHDVRRNKMGTG